MKKMMTILSLVFISWTIALTANIAYAREYVCSVRLNSADCSSSTAKVNISPKIFRTDEERLLANSKDTALIRGVDAYVTSAGGEKLAQGFYGYSDENVILQVSGPVCLEIQKEIARRDSPSSHSARIEAIVTVDFTSTGEKIVKKLNSSQVVWYGMAH